MQHQQHLPDILPHALHAPPRAPLHVLPAPKRLQRRVGRAFEGEGAPEAALLVLAVGQGAEEAALHAEDAEIVPDGAGLCG